MRCSLSKRGVRPSRWASRASFSLGRSSGWIRPSHSPGLSPTLVFAAADEGLPSRREEDAVGSQIPIPEPVVGAGHSQGIALFARPQPVFRLPALRDIAARQKHLAAVPQPGREHLEDARDSALVTETGVARLPLPGPLDSLGEHAPQHRPILGMGEIEERCAGGVFGAIPERGGERGAGIADPSVGVEDQDDVGKTLDQATIVALCEAFERVGHPRGIRKAYARVEGWSIDGDRPNRLVTFVVRSAP